MSDYSTLNVYDANRQPIKLADLWRDQPTLLFFLRSPGCSICRDKLFDLKRNFEQFSERNIKVVAISLVSPMVLQGLIQQYQLPFAMYCDIYGQAYQAFNFQHTDEDLFSNPEIVRRAEEAASRGHVVSDTLGVPFSQLGGVVMFDRAAHEPSLIHVANPIYVYPEWHELLTLFDHDTADIA